MRKPQERWKETLQEEEQQQQMWECSRSPKLLVYEALSLSY
jgi:hypothetical protein